MRALEKQPRAGLKRPAAEEFQRAAAGRKINAERVVGVARRYEEVVGDWAAAAVAQAKRFGRCLGGRCTPGIGSRGEDLQSGPCCIPGAGEQVDALVRRSEVVVVGAVVVEAVRGHKGVEVCGCGVGRIEGGNIGAAVVQYAVIQGNAGARSKIGPEHEPALRSEGGAKG